MKASGPKVGLPLRVPVEYIERLDVLAEKMGVDWSEAGGGPSDSLATNLARFGVSPRVAMELMRHSDASDHEDLYRRFTIAHRRRDRDAAPVRSKR